MSVSPSCITAADKLSTDAFSSPSLYKQMIPVYTCNDIISD